MGCLMTKAGLLHGSLRLSTPAPAAPICHLLLGGPVLRKRAPDWALEGGPGLPSARWGCGQLTCDEHPLAVGFALLELVALGQLPSEADEPPRVLAGLQHPVGADGPALLLLAHLRPPRRAPGRGAVAQGFPLPALPLAHLHGARAHAAAPRQAALHLGLETWGRKQRR